MDRLLSPQMMPIVLAGVILLILLIAVVVVVLRRSQGDTVAQRLNEFTGAADAAQPAANPREALERIDKVVSKSKQGSNIGRDLARADVKLTVAEFYLAKMGMALVGAAAGAFVGRASPAAMFASALIGAVIFSFMPNMYLGYRAKSRLTAFNNQLGDTITMMSNALRGGYSFLMTLDLVAKEAPYPVNVEFRRVVQEVGLGRSTEEALGNLQRRVPSEDLDLLITAVNIQMEVGGNLAQILDTIGHTIRERVRIKGEINTLTAQGRISAWVITGLPVGLAIFISVVNPNYMAPIFTFGMPPEAWCCLPVASLTMIVIGFFSIMKIMDIEV
ncbi:MAG: type II secretion system F family protein [Oscillochloridaceae bacterium umkhey_bin13]